MLDSPEVSFFANGMDGEALDMAELNDKMIATSAADERRSNVYNLYVLVPYLACM